MDIGRSFTYITEDQDWIKKVLLGGLISLIPIVGQLFILGYLLQVIQNVIAGREVPLPELGDFGVRLVKGFMLWLVVLIYSLPLIIISACANVGNLAPALAGNADPDTVNVITTVLAVLSACFGCLSLLYAILMGLMLPFAFGRYAETEQFGDAFQLGKVFEMLKNNIGPAIITLLVVGLASAVAGVVGMIACIIGLIFTAFYAQLVMAFLYGSLYRKAKSTVL